MPKYLDCSLRSVLVADHCMAPGSVGGATAGDGVGVEGGAAAGDGVGVEGGAAAGDGVGVVGGAVGASD